MTISVPTPGRLDRDLPDKDLLQLINRQGRLKVPSDLDQRILGSARSALQCVDTEPRKSHVIPSSRVRILVLAGIALLLLLLFVSASGNYPENLTVLSGH